MFEPQRHVAAVEVSSAYIDSPNGQPRVLAIDLVEVHERDLEWLDVIERRAIDADWCAHTHAASGLGREKSLERPE